jgi:hypothetical protein
VLTYSALGSTPPKLAPQNAKNVVSILFHRGAEIPGDHPRLERDGRLACTMRFADGDQLEAGRAELEAVIRDWCDSKDG